MEPPKTWDAEKKAFVHKKKKRIDLYAIEGLDTPMINPDIIPPGYQQHWKEGRYHLIPRKTWKVVHSTFRRKEV